MKLSRLSIPYRSVKGLGVVLLVAVFSSGSAAAGGLEYLILSALLFLGIAGIFFLWQYLVWRNFDYFVTADSVEIQHGVFRKNVRDIPLRRVQNVDIQRNLVHRLLGIAQVNFETAGGQETEASLRYVEHEDAKEVQRKVRRLKKGLEEEEESEEETMYEMDFRDLVLLGLFSADPRSAVAVFVLLSVAGGAIGTAIESFNIAASIVVLGLAVMLLATVWVGGALTSIARYFDFKLRRADEALEYERGLLNRSSGSIPFEKIQSLTLEENPLKRFFGYATLRIETAGYAAQTAEEKGSEAAIPLARTDRVMDFVEDLYDERELNIEKVSPRARQRYMARYSILSLFLIAGSFIPEFFTGYRWFLLLLLPLSAMAAHYRYVNRGYSLMDRHFVARNGFWNRKTMIVPYYRIQNLIRSETFFQRRWSLSTLTLDTAGGSVLGTRNAKAVDLDVSTSREVATETFERFRKSI